MCICAGTGFLAMRPSMCLFIISSIETLFANFGSFTLYQKYTFLWVDQYFANTFTKSFILHWFMHSISAILQAWLRSWVLIGFPMLLVVSSDRAVNVSMISLCMHSSHSVVLRIMVYCQLTPPTLFILTSTGPARQKFVTHSAKNSPRTGADWYMHFGLWCKK